MSCINYLIDYEQSWGSLFYKNHLIKRSCLLFKAKKAEFNKQTIDTLMPGTPLIEIFFGVNTLRLGGLKL